MSLAAAAATATAAAAAATAAAATTAVDGRLALLRYHRIHLGPPLLCHGLLCLGLRHGLYLLLCHSAPRGLLRERRTAGRRRGRRRNGRAGDGSAAAVLLMLMLLNVERAAGIGIGSGGGTPSSSSSSLPRNARKVDGPQRIRGR